MVLSELVVIKLQGVAVCCYEPPFDSSIFFLKLSGLMSVQTSLM